MKVDGKLVASKLKQKIEDKILGRAQKRVAFVIFGEDPGSKQYIGMKKRFAESLGIKADVYSHSDEITGEEVKLKVKEVVDMQYDGMVVQLPLPKSVVAQEVLDMVPVEMDMDVLSEFSKLEYKNNKTDKVPPVARAVLEILNFYNIDLLGKEILVVGNGKLVGEPVGNMLQSKKIKYNKIDRSTDEALQKELLKNADIIISGAGSPHFIKKDMVRQGVVLIDAGTSEQSGKLVGDVDPECEEVARLITPVPNGVGPVTMVCLFLNI